MGNEESHPQQSQQQQASARPPRSPRRSGGGSSGGIRRSPVETLFRRLHQEAQVQFDPDRDAGHMLLLRQMWSCFNRGDEFKRRGDEWQAVGFQASDPVTDFRATGLMGAKVTKRVLEKNKTLVEYFLTDVVVLESCLGNGVYYPLMANCVAVLVGVCKLIGLAENTQSANLFKLRDEETAVKEISASHGGAPALSSSSSSSSLSSTGSAGGGDGAEATGGRTASGDLARFFKNVEKTLKGIGTPAAVAARREMQLNSLFQDARSFDLLLLHVMIRFHRRFMREAIHAGATYMDCSAILAATLIDTAAWLRQPLPVFERLRYMQEQQTHYNSNDYVSEYIADIMMRQQRRHSAVEAEAYSHAEAEREMEAGAAAAEQAAAEAQATPETASNGEAASNRADGGGDRGGAAEQPSSGSKAGAAEASAAAAVAGGGEVPATATTAPATAPAATGEDGVSTEGPAHASSGASLAVVLENAQSSPAATAAARPLLQQPQSPPPPSFALASRFQTLSTGLGRKISSVLLKKSHVALEGLPEVSMDDPSSPRGSPRGSPRASLTNAAGNCAGVATTAVDVGVRTSLAGGDGDDADNADDDAAAADDDDDESTEDMEPLPALQLQQSEQQAINADNAENVDSADNADGDNDAAVQP